MKMRIVLPAAAAVTITALAIVSFARGEEATTGRVAHAAGCVAFAETCLPSD